MFVEKNQTPKETLLPTPVGVEWVGVVWEILFLP
jgi:hypothetical protein